MNYHQNTDTTQYLLEDVSFSKYRIVATQLRMDCRIVGALQKISAIQHRVQFNELQPV